MSNLSFPVRRLSTNFLLATAVSAFLLTGCAVEAAKFGASETVMPPGVKKIVEKTNEASITA